MDPASIGTPEWSEISKLLRSLWIVVTLIVLFATNMILGHNMIPSLVATGDLPKSFQKVRRAFYAMAVMSFGLALFFLSRVVDFAGVLRDFWSDYWI